MKCIIPKKEDILLSSLKTEYILLVSIRSIKMRCYLYRSARLDNISDSFVDRMLLCDRRFDICLFKLCGDIFGSAGLITDLFRSHFRVDI